MRTAISFTDGATIEKPIERGLQIEQLTKALDPTVPIKLVTRL